MIVLLIAIEIIVIKKLDNLSQEEISNL